MVPKQLWLCLFCVGILQSASCHLQMFYNSSDQITRIEAFKVCQEQSMNLVTLYSEDDAKFVSSFGRPSVWIGLHRIKNNNILEPPTCPSWTAHHYESKDCSKELNFMCERGSYLENVKLNWCSARQYCHYHLLGDLISGDGTIDTDETIWIQGNMNDDWKWDDGGCSIYREWGANPEPIGKVSILMGEKMYVTPSELGEKSTVCSKGDVRIVVIRNVSTWEEALDYCDTRHSGLLQITSPEDQDTVEKWVNKTTSDEDDNVFWVGLRQSRVFGFWIWKDRMVEYGNWATGTHPEMPLSHQCGVIEKPEFKWRDNNCMDQLPFLCEERIVRMP